MTLDDVCEFVVDCEHKTAPIAADGYPSIRTPNIGRGRLILAGANRVSEETYREWTRRKVPTEGDLILAREAPVGNVAMIPPGLKVCLGQRTVLIRPDKSRIDPNYLLYLLLGSDVQGRIRLIATGATVGHLNVKDIRELELPVLAPVPDQRKIGAILSSYDDLIENNKRRIRILEDMARTIFMAWFVKLRFPGYDGVPSLNSKNGNIPEGWELTTLDSVLAELEAGSRPAGGVGEIDEGVPSIGAENILGLGQYNYGIEKFVSRDFYESMRRGHVKSGDVLLYKDGAKIGRKSLFRDGFPHQTCCVNEHVFILRSNEHCAQSYLYFWLDQPKITQDIRNLNANAAQPGINQQSVRNLPILLPPIDLVTAFDETIEAVLALLFDLAKKNRLLQQIRDALLNRLVSGELDVSDLDFKVEDDKS